VYKVIWLVRFRQDMAREDVVRWWREDHGPLAGKTPGMVRYVQNHWTDPLESETFLVDPDGQLAFDGHAEHWFETYETYKAAMASPEWAATQRDGPNGFDSSTLVGASLDEYTVL
jgi:uncharacterized protein (TIGR02118 family)